jgi:hypothetical protein
VRAGSCGGVSMECALRPESTFGAAADRGVGLGFGELAVPAGYRMGYRVARNLAMVERTANSSQQVDRNSQQALFEV